MTIGLARASNGSVDGFTKGGSAATSFAAGNISEGSDMTIGLARMSNELVKGFAEGCSAATSCAASSALCCPAW